MNGYTYNKEEKKIYLHQEKCSVLEILLMAKIIENLAEKHSLTFVDENHDLIWDAYQEAIKQAGERIDKKNE